MPLNWMKRLWGFAALVLALVLYYHWYVWLETRNRMQSKHTPQNFQEDGEQVIFDPDIQIVTVDKFTNKTKNGENQQPTTSSLKQRMKNWTTVSKTPHFETLSKTQLAQTSDTVRNSTNITSTRSKFPNSRKPLNISDFTAEPKWEFDNYYTLDTSSTQTSCAISVKIKAANSSWLKEIFIPQIAIFMDNRHFSDKEWERLEHYKTPFGWMTLNYTDVKEAVSGIPHLPDQQILLSARKTEAPRCISCAVVGNGGILNGSRLGKEIDKHDYVFRMNGALIKGFEADVGIRTSFYAFTAQTMYASQFFLHDEGFTKIPMSAETRYIHYTEGWVDYYWLKTVQKNETISEKSLWYFSKHPRDDFGSSFNLSNLLVVHPDFMRYVKDRYLRSNNLNGNYWNIYRPSTGAFVLLTTLHLCDMVSAYGFMTEDYDSYSVHYYDKLKEKVVLYANHDSILEKNLWKKLHEENIINLYQRT